MPAAQGHIIQAAFPVLNRDFPVLGKRIRSSIPKENCPKTSVQPPDFKQCECRYGLVFANFPVSFPVIREFGIEIG
jgi:hypothetical protein